MKSRTAAGDDEQNRKGVCNPCDERYLLFGRELPMFVLERRVHSAS